MADNMEKVLGIIGKKKKISYNQILEDSKISSTCLTFVLADLEEKKLIKKKETKKEIFYKVQKNLNKNLSKQIEKLEVKIQLVKDKIQSIKEKLKKAL